MLPLVDDVRHIPPITKLMVIFAVGLTACVHLNICTPFSLYFNWNLIVNQNQVFSRSLRV